MPNEVVKVRRDRVTYRVPGFQNFGSRMEELESEQLHRVMSDPNHPKQLGDAMQKMAAALGSAAGDAKKAIDANRQKDPETAKFMESAMADLMKMIGETVKEAELELDKLDDEPDKGIAQPVAFAKSNRNPELLEIQLADRHKWSEDAQTSVDKLLNQWPTLRPKILKAVFEAYRDAYDDIWAFAGGQPHDKITLPNPTSPNVIEELFYIDGIHLDEKNRIVGLTGSCTWEDEHGLGVRLKSGKIVEVGYADVVYQ